MRISEVLAKVDELKPNQYDDQQKIEWITTLDGKVFTEVISTHEIPMIEEKRVNEETGEEETITRPLLYTGYTENDTETELLVLEPYSDIYIHYIFAMIDFYNQEIDRYNNSMMMFNARYADFRAWYNRNHMPVQKQLKLF